MEEIAPLPPSPFARPVYYIQHRHFLHAGLIRKCPSHHSYKTIVGGNWIWIASPCRMGGILKLVISLKYDGHNSASVVNWYILKMVLHVSLVLSPSLFPYYLFIFSYMRILNTQLKTGNRQFYLCHVYGAHAIGKDLTQYIGPYIGLH